MSIIQTFYNQTVMNTRDITSTPTSSDVTVTVSSFPCVIRPVSDVSKLFVESNIGKEYEMVCDDTEDVLVGDSIHGDRTYETIGVSKYQDLEDDSESHLDVRLVSNG